MLKHRVKSKTNWGGSLSCEGVYAVGLKEMLAEFEETGNISLGSRCGGGELQHRDRTVREPGARSPCPSVVPRALLSASFTHQTGPGPRNPVGLGSGSHSRA